MLSLSSSAKAGAASAASGNGEKSAAADEQHAVLVKAAPSPRRGLIARARRQGKAERPAEPPPFERRGALRRAETRYVRRARAASPGEVASRRRGAAATPRATAAYSAATFGSRASEASSAARRSPGRAACRRNSRVGLHVEMAVARQIEQDRRRLAFLARLQRLVDRRPDRMVRFRRRHDSLGAREHHARLEARVLVIGARLDQAELLAMADQRPTCRGSAGRRRGSRAG